ncbi:glycine oxidase ThiO [Mesorhizobium xinjiangense]|uniref:glycine oxidase ThiO n=1 Tax=Mesorhizobium xinjiangense TaxID=2678685 RepID=UPI0012ED8069|nr:glycine oxidase ThiO [Mesorhizobium xinjiangense]
MQVFIRGAGVAGLTLAHELTVRGASVTVADIRTAIAGNASWLAGGMLAPWCERESAEEAVLTLGRAAADWWDGALPGHVVRNGTLMVAPARDAAELSRFAARTGGFQWLEGTQVAELEPDLAGRFRQALFFAGEAHLDPRVALLALYDRLEAAGVRFASGRQAADVLERDGNWDIVADCTGMASRQAGLRGVRGEMLILHAPDVTLSRPVRLLHPRFPVYVVPRADHHFMVGATMIESEDRGPVTARSMMELLNAAYSLHPAFGEARIVETGVGIRPAYADNLPRMRRDGRRLTINGLYRHGFLLAPAMARQAAATILRDRLEVLHETHR